MHDDAYWRKHLTPEQYAVLREKGTEAPYSGALLEEQRDGSYQCAACGTTLFSADTKFDSHCGWPSFYDALPDTVDFLPKIVPAVCGAPKSLAIHAAVIWDISFLMPQTNQPASGTALTRWR